MQIEHDFIHDPNLLLYLPLHKLDGAVLASQDAGGKQCTPSGPLWTPQGYSFDGVDDTIVIPGSAVVTGDAARTVIIWFYWTDDAATSVLIRWGTAGVPIHRQFILQLIPTHQLNISTYGHDPNSPVDSVKIFTWYCGVITYPENGGSINNVRFELNGVNQIMTQPGGGPLATTDANPRIGNPTSAQFKGIIGEVIILNRELFPGESQRYYEETKWRYR